MPLENPDSEDVYTFGDHSCTAYRLGSGDESIAIVTENHGDEKGPLQVVEEMVDKGSFEYENLSLTIISGANTYASEACRRRTPLDIQEVESDQHDLNRTYENARRALEESMPMQKLNTTEQLAYKVLEYIDELEPDLVIDMHTGTSGTVKVPQIRYKYREEFNTTEDSMRSIAENAGVDMINKESSTNAQMMGAVLPKIGFPALTIEVGGGVRFGYKGAFEENESRNYEEIIQNILDFKLEGIKSGYDPEEFTEIRKNHAPIEAESAEIEYLFELGDKIETGDTVATLDMEGEKIDIEAVEPGVLETVRAENSRNNIRHGNRIFNIAVK